MNHGACWDDPSPVHLSGRESGRVDLFLTDSGSRSLGCFDVKPVRIWLEDGHDGDYDGDWCPACLHDLLDCWLLYPMRMLPCPYIRDQPAISVQGVLTPASALRLEGPQANSGDLVPKSAFSGRLNVSCDWCLQVIVWRGETRPRMVCTTAAVLGPSCDVYSAMGSGCIALAVGDAIPGNCPPYPVLVACMIILWLWTPHLCIISLRPGLIRR